MTYHFRLWRHLASVIAVQGRVRSWVQPGSDRHIANVTRLTRNGLTVVHRLDRKQRAETMTSAVEAGFAVVRGSAVSSNVAEFRTGKSTVRCAYSRDGDNCAMQLRHRVQAH